MTTFSQWWLGQQKNPTPRQFTYLCGPESILIEEIVNTVRDNLHLEPWAVSYLSAGEDSDRTIWSEVDQMPNLEDNRLVVIRNAEQLKNWQRFYALVKERTRNPNTHLVLISNELRAPMTEPTFEQKRDGEKPKLLPHLAALSGKGYVIECRPFTAATAKHAVTWVQSKLGVSTQIAAHLLNRANGDLRLVRDVCVKLAVFEKITISMVNELLSEQPRDEYTEALMSLNKKSALQALARLPEMEYSRVIGLLDSQLDLASLVHDMQIEHRSQGEIAKAAGSRGFLVKDMVDVAKHYDHKRCLAARKVLSRADEALRRGERVGIMEYITEAW